MKILLTTSVVLAATGAWLSCQTLRAVQVLHADGYCRTVCGSWWAAAGDGLLVTLPVLALGLVVLRLRG